MDDQAFLTRIVRLEAKVDRIETMMQAVLLRLGINPAEIMPPDPPEDRAMRDAIRAELLMGNKVKAIKLYCDYYGANLKEARDAINALL